MYMCAAELATWGVGLDVTYFTVRLHTSIENPEKYNHGVKNTFVEACQHEKKKKTH